MPYRICKTFEIENGHMLSKHPDNCRFPHGHTRRVECILEADALDANDMVCDYKAVRQALEAFVERFDHALCVNTRDAKYADLKQAYGERVIGFEGQDPTTEMLAKTLFDAFRERLQASERDGEAMYVIPDAVRLARVRVWETSSTWAEYGEP